VTIGGAEGEFVSPEGEALPAPSAKVRRNDLDEMTVGRTEKPLGAGAPQRGRSIGGRAGSQAGRRGRK
jgi:hypothetical protein